MICIGKTKFTSEKGLLWVVCGLYSERWGYAVGWSLVKIFQGSSRIFEDLDEDLCEDLHQDL